MTVRALAVAVGRAGRTGAVVPVIVLVAASAVAGRAGGGAEVRFPVALRELVGSGDPLAAQGLRFDGRFARTALAYLASGRPDLLTDLSRQPATTFLLSHARQFDYDVPKGTGLELVADLLKNYAARNEDAATCRESLAYFSGPMLADPHWVSDTLAYLPKGFRFHGTLFLTFGYDIGVALAPDASLNGAYRHFAGRPRELVYYAIHELHHVGFMTYQPPPRIDSLKSWADVLRFVDYATQLEGMAVLAAFERRRVEGALDADKDYLALQDEDRMRRDEASYFEIRSELARRGGAPTAADVSAALERFSAGERLWYRVGAWMAMRIERANGRAALVRLVKEGPRKFMETYIRLRQKAGP